MRLNKVNAQDVLKIINNLLILAMFIYLSVNNGVYPWELKIDNIRPLYKQGSHIHYANYRPIAILSVINKIVENVLHQVTNFLESHYIILDSQHGFRRRRSTATALTGFDWLC